VLIALKAFRERLRSAVAHRLARGGRRPETEKELALLEQQRWSADLQTEDSAKPPPSDRVWPYGYSVTVWTLDLIARGYPIALG
jgi:hypothetical protein